MNNYISAFERMLARNPRGTDEREAITAAIALMRGQSEYSPAGFVVDGPSAAHAGGDYPNGADGLALELVSVTEERDFLRRRVAELSAPAGAGDVSIGAAWLELVANRWDKSQKISPMECDRLLSIAALLRKLQQGY